MSTALLYDSEEALYGTSSPRLVKATVSLLSEPEAPWEASRPLPPRSAPDTEIILRLLAPKLTDPLAPELPADPSFAMTDHVEGTGPKDALSRSESFQGELSIRDHHGQLDVRDLTEKATAGLLEHEAASKSAQSDEHYDPESRHDSAQDRVPQLSLEKREQLSLQESSPALRLQTTQDPSHREHPLDTIATSPQLSKHLITTNDAIATLPAFHTISPIREGSISSAQGEKLPSLQQVVGPQLGPLNELAEAATTQQDASAGTRHHSQSFGSSTAPSPLPPYQSYHNHPQSASPYFVHHSARSPTSTISDQNYISPPHFPNVAYYGDRRSSAPVDHAPNFPPSLPSASSAESHGATNSSIDGYSTAQTTPGEAPDAPPRPILPPPAGMPHSSIDMGAGFRCDYPGCNSVPFQTQYLLSSHRNVHSQVRNHYCPVEGCPRSEGGKGFKRKNEMIRHGLVHDSPGYVCPFCPDKEHKYPRPDNLQRHVRVHHVDKDKDDPLLREVLAQRREGPGTTRRRRANTAGSST